MPDEWWTVKDVAAFLEITPGSVRHYLRLRKPEGNPFPVEDRRFGATLVWRPETVMAWNERRPGRGRWGKR